MIWKVSLKTPRSKAHANARLTPSDEVFKDVHKKYGRVGTRIRGYRYRDDMTQSDLAKKLNISKKDVYNLEYSRLKIDRKMAKQLATLFKTKPSMFLD